MPFPAVPQNVQDYFWKLLMSAMFIIATVLSMRYLGPTAPPVPVPVEVHPVVVVQDADGYLTIHNYSPAK